jgi:hypothetical protein
MYIHIIILGIIQFNYCVAQVLFNSNYCVLGILLVDVYFLDDLADLRLADLRLADLFLGFYAFQIWSCCVSFS